MGYYLFRTGQTILSIQKHNEFLLINYTMSMTTSNQHVFNINPNCFEVQNVKNSLTLLNKMLARHQRHFVYLK